MGVGEFKYCDECYPKGVPAKIATMNLAKSTCFICKKKLCSMHAYEVSYSSTLLKVDLGEKLSLCKECATKLARDHIEKNRKFQEKFKQLIIDFMKGRL